MDQVHNSGEAPAPPSIRAVVISLVALYGVTTIHHLYGGLFLSSPNRLLVPALLLLPFAAAILALVVYRRTRSRAALWTSATIALVLAGLLGILHSAYSHIYKDVVYLAGGPADLYVLLNPDEHFPPDDLFFEATGVIELAASIAVVVTVLRLLRTPVARATTSTRSAGTAVPR